MLDRGATFPLVLLVEDSEDLRHLLEDLLRQEGYRVHGFGDAEGAFESARAEHPSVVVTDIGLGATSGLDLITRLRSDLPPPTPPIIACSGFPGYAEEALRRGAMTFIDKPIAIESLLEAIASALQDESVTPSVTTEAHRRSKELRRRALELSEAAIARLMVKWPALTARAGRTAQWLAGYLDTGPAVVALLHDGCLRVLGSSDERLLPVDAPLRDLIPVAQHVLESTSNIVIPDVTLYGLGGRLGARFFAGVPLIVDGFGIGAVCVLSEEAGRLDGEDLTLLEELGRRAAAALGDAYRTIPRFWTDEGLISREGIELLLDLETRRMQRWDGQLLLVVVEAGDTGWIGRLEATMPPQRLAIGHIETTRFALLLVRDGSGFTEHEVKAMLDDLVAEYGLRGIGLVSVEGSAVSLPVEALTRVAGTLCERSVRSGQRWIEELSIRHRIARDTNGLGAATPPPI